MQPQDAFSSLRQSAPPRPGKIIGIGLNYANHVQEAGLEAPASPPIFAKFPTAVIGDGQWTRSKSLDTCCPLGPVVVAAERIPDPQDLDLRTRVNGETVQDSNTAEMIFGVAELLAFCSHSFTLEPGDVVLTGTPPGCGEFMDPPRSLADGDVVEVEIDGIGTLRNPVVEVSR